MLSLRTIARSAPRLASSSLRQSVARSSGAYAYRAAAAVASYPLRTNAVASFSTTGAHRAAESDGELSAKLESEIQIEEDMKSNEQQPASVKDFLANSAFELIDTPGQEVVKLVRNFGEEK